MSASCKRACVALALLFVTLQTAAATKARSVSGNDAGVSARDGGVANGPRRSTDGGLYSAYGVPDLTVPFADAEVPVEGVMVVNGMVMKLKAVHSTLPPEELYAHFADEFARQGLYVDESIVIPGYSNPHLTGLDPVRRIAYTALLTRERDGTTVFLGETHLSPNAAVPNADGFPLYPGAASVVRADVEAAHRVVYVVRARPSDVRAFYSAALTDAGFDAAAEGAWEGRGRRLSVDLAARGDETVVTVTAKFAQ